MPRFSRRRRLTALLLLVWQGAVLAPGAVAAHAAQQLPFGESQSVAQAAMPAAKGIPAEVVQWFDAMKEAADKGDGAKALEMHQKVLAWVQANLPEVHVFRARVLVRFGYVLESMSKYQEALPPTQEGAEMLRRIVAGNQDVDAPYFLAIALHNLGKRYSNLNQSQKAIVAFQEASEILKGLAKSQQDAQDVYPPNAFLLGSELVKAGQFETASEIYLDLAGLLRNSVKTSPSRQDRLAAVFVSLADVYVKLEQPQKAVTAWEEALPLLREQAMKNPAKRDDVTKILIFMFVAYRDLGQVDKAKTIVAEVISSLNDWIRLRSAAGVKISPQSEALAHAYVVLASAYLLAGQPQKALTLNEKALVILSELAKADAYKMKSWAYSWKLSFDIYAQLGLLQEAVDLCLKSLSMLRDAARNNPAVRPELAKILILLGNNYFPLVNSPSAMQAAYQEASTLLQQHLPELRKEARNSRYKQVVLTTTLISLSQALRGSGQVKESLTPASEALQIARDLISADPANREQVVNAQSNLADSYSLLSKLDQALAIAKEAVQEAREFAKSNPAKKIVLATALTNLANKYNDLGQMPQAAATAREAAIILREQARINPELHGTRATLLLGSLWGMEQNLGSSESALATATDAVLALKELPENDFTKRYLMPGGLVMQGFSHTHLGQWREGLARTQEGLKLSETFKKSDVLGKPMRQIVLVLSSMQYSLAGRRQEALAAAQEAQQLDSGSEAISSSSPLVGLRAAGLIMLGYHYKNIGQAEEALVPSAEAVRLSRLLAQSSRSNRSLLSGSLDLLSRVYLALGRNQDALAAASESVQITKQLAIDNPPALSGAAYPLASAAQAHYGLGQTDQAIQRGKQAVLLLRKSSETDVLARAGLAHSLRELGRYIAASGRIPEAMAPSTEAVEIFRAMANDTPEVLDKLSESSTNLAILLLSQGQDIAAIPLMREAVGSEVRFLQQQLPLMPEGRRQALVDTLGRRWELPFSLALRGEDGASLALYTRLNRHGPLQDVERRQAIIARSSPANQALVTRLSILNAQISNPTLAPQGRQHSIRESERLQEQLHSQLPALKPRLVEISQVARQLPADGALVEFQRFSPYNPAKPEKEAWGKPRYLALVLDRGGVARAMDLGDAAALDQAIASALDRTRLQLPEADRAWVLVAEKVFSPLAVILAGKRQLLLSPDGELHRVPFSALALLAGNTPLVPATLRLQTIGSGRDLIPDPVAPQPPAPAAPLVLADPTTSGWPSLVRAAREGQEVASALGVKALLGRAATVSALEQARGPRIIHVAGHGYFDPQAKGDPLLASGLSLAGADKAKQPSQTQDQPSSPQLPALSTMPNAVPSDDGYLTAKEAARLQLEGTALVVLSACESGRGNNRSGEGLFGLRRSLTVAGARGTLLSLWRVPEHATETFMTRFYTHLRQGVSPAQAVRQVQEEFRSKPRIPGWSDPFYWAGWQYSGLPDPVR